MNAGIAIFTLLASQLIGYAFAGMLQEALVYPSVTFWPGTIVPANMFQALHFDGGLGSKRTKLFWAVFAGIFCWEIFPQWIFPMLTGVSIFCMASFSPGSRTFASNIILRSTTLPPSFGISSVVQATTRAWGQAV
jgi:hypothetical protein